MTTFGVFSAPAKELLTQALEDEAFRARLLTERRTVFAEFNLDNVDIGTLENIIFDGVWTDSDLFFRLSQYAKESPFTLA